MRSLRAILLTLGVALGVPAACVTTFAATRTGADAAYGPNVPTRVLSFGDAKLVLHYDPKSFRVADRDIDDWVLRSARAATGYFGRFPAQHVDIAIQPGKGREVGEGEANADPDPRIRIVVGRDMTAAQLKRDSTMVHEMAHLGFPDVDEAHLWLHEGFATYVESIARAQTREAKPHEVWGHFTRVMEQGLPGDDARGLDRTRNEDRRYYGGALFWLTADIEIRKRTANRRGVQDAIRAIHAAGGNLAVEWSPEKSLAIGDAAVGVDVLVPLFATWKKTAVSPDLASLWQSLGVARTDGRVVLVNDAPLAAIRQAITAQPAKPILLRAPAMLYEATRTP